MADFTLDRDAMGRLVLTQSDGSAHTGVVPVRAFPIGAPDEGLSLMSADGHELASHGFAHQRASEQSPEAFFSDIQLAKIVLEDTCGTEVRGYRAPSFSIGEANAWAFECIERAGYLYSSSVYPIRHDHYGTPDAPRFTHDVREGLAASYRLPD